MLRLVELLAGLSRLADLGYSLPPGSSLRSAALALALGRSLDLSDHDLRCSMYTALLLHVGCTGYAHETAHATGDEMGWNTAARLPTRTVVEFRCSPPVYSAPVITPPSSTSMAAPRWLANR